MLRAIKQLKTIFFKFVKKINFKTNFYAAHSEIKKKKIKKFQANKKEETNCFD
jgi:hypothetical protein